jgi:uncharacterized protein (TIGR00255 family)
MPVFSMTGYASAQSSGAPHESGQADAVVAPRLGVEIRAVNSRFLDLSFRLADDLRQHEPALRELLQSRLKRGKVEVRAGLESVSGADLRDPGARLLQRLNTLQDQIRSWLPQAHPLSVADVLRLAASGETPAADSGTHLLPLVQQTLEALLAARAREGTAVILSSHLLHLVEELCTRLLVIRRGQMVAFGTIDEIVSARPELAGRSLEEMFIALTGDDAAPDITGTVAP